VKEGRRLESTGSAPIYYLVFPVEEILEVKRQTKAWTAKLENLGWNVTTLSFVEIQAQTLEKILMKTLHIFFLQIFHIRKLLYHYFYQ
jgi:hypothetical protein